MYGSDGASGFFSCGRDDPGLFHFGTAFTHITTKPRLTNVGASTAFKTKRSLIHRETSRVRGRRNRIVVCICGVFHSSCLEITSPNLEMKIDALESTTKPRLTNVGASAAFKTKRSLIHRETSRVRGRRNRIVMCICGVFHSSCLEITSPNLEMKMDSLESWERRYRASGVRTVHPLRKNGSPRDREGFR